MSAISVVRWAKKILLVHSKQEETFISLLFFFCCQVLCFRAWVPCVSQLLRLWSFSRQSVQRIGSRKNFTNGRRGRTMCSRRIIQGMGECRLQGEDLFPLDTLPLTDAFTGTNTRTYAHRITHLFPTVPFIIRFNLFEKTSHKYIYTHVHWSLSFTVT